MDLLLVFAAISTSMAGTAMILGFAHMFGLGNLLTPLYERKNSRIMRPFVDLALTDGELSKLSLPNVDLKSLQAFNKAVFLAYPLFEGIADSIDSCLRRLLSSHVDISARTELLTELFTLYKDVPALANAKPKGIKEYRSYHFTDEPPEETYWVNEGTALRKSFASWEEEVKLLCDEAQPAIRPSIRNQIPALKLETPPPSWFSSSKVREFMDAAAIAESNWKAVESTVQEGVNKMRADATVKTFNSYYVKEATPLSSDLAVSRELPELELFDLIEIQEEKATEDYPQRELGDFN